MELNLACLSTPITSTQSRSGGIEALHLQLPLQFILERLGAIHFGARHHTDIAL